VVYINGGAGNKVTVTKAIATGDPTSAQTFGILITDISNNQNGYACVLGLLENLNTSAYTEGQQLYLSPTVAGAFTTTKPSAPNHMVYVGIVERVHVNQGTIQVRIQNGYALEELHNVAISSVANNQGLFYESSTSLWKNKSIATVLGYTPLADAPSDGTTYGRKDGAWYAVASGGGTWGSITGTLSSQTDLQDALDLKYDASNPSAFIDATALASYAPLAGPAFSGTATFTGSGGTVSISDLSLDLSASTGGGAVIVGTSGITFSDSTIQQTAYNPDRAKADAIANIIYTQSSGSTGDICFSNVPQFISNLTTNWGIVDSSIAYENCTGFSGATYSLSGSVGSGPYKVRVNGVDSSFTI
jgi:hypothetical protein